nr:MAG TPA: stabilization protein [Caudoviricetes sp.]
MAKKLFSHNSFIGGQVDRELIGKTTNTMSYARNVVSSLKGELRARTGTRLVSFFDTTGKLVPFRLNANDILLFFSDKRLRAFTFDTTNQMIPFEIGTGEAITFPTTGWNSNTNGDWTLGGSFASQNFYTAVNGTGIKLTVNDLANPSYLYIDGTEPHILKSIKVRFYVDGQAPSSQRPHENYPKNGTLQYSDDGTHWFAIETQTENIKKETNITGTNFLGDTFNVSYSATLTNVTHYNGHKYWRVYFETGMSGEIFIKYDTTFWMENVTYGQDQTGPLDITTNITSDDLNNLVYAQMDNNLFLTFGDRIPVQIKYLTPDFSVTDFTPTSTSGIWETNGFPKCVSVYAGRLWFAGFDTIPNRVIASEFNNIQNFTVKTKDVVATDPISINGRRLKSGIQNMFGAEKALYLLSEDGVSMIDAPDGTIVSTTMIEAQLRNQEPTAGIAPIVKDDVMLYIGYDKKKILMTDYDFVVQRFKAANLSYGYNEFFASGIAKMQYISKTPGLIYGTLNNGQWFSLLYNDQTANSLFPFETNGQIIDLLALKYNNRTKLLMFVSRNNIFCLEEKSDESFSEIQYLGDPLALQEYSEEKIMSEFYMDMVRHIAVDGMEFPEPITFDADNLTITTTDANQEFYNMARQTGCEVYLQNKQTTKKLHVKLNGIVDSDTKKISVFLFDDSEITTTSTFYPKLKAQTKIIQDLKVSDADYEIVGDSQYIGKMRPQEQILTLEKPLWNLFYGLPYEKIGVITEIGNPMTRKTWGSVSLVVQDTLHLQIGARQDKLESLIEYKPTGSEYNIVPKMTSGAITKNIADTDEYVKNLILYSDKALPFCVIGLVADGSVSDMGGN